jgi:hypothetical protein
MAVAISITAERYSLKRQTVAFGTAASRQKRCSHREDVAKFMPSGEENHGHIEIIADVAHEQNGQIHQIKTVGAGSNQAQVKDHKYRTTFGRTSGGKFAFSQHTWVLRPRLAK